MKSGNTGLRSAQSTRARPRGRDIRRRRFRPLERWKTAWRVCVWLGVYLPAIFATLTMVRIVVNPYHAPALTSAELMEGTSEYEAVVVLALLVQAVPLAVWLFRAHANLDAFGVQPVRLRPWMVAVSWIVPILNVVLTTRALGDSWRGAGPKAPANPTWRSLRVPRGITVWWLSLWAVAVGVCLFATYAPPSRLDHVSVRHYLAYATLLLLVVAARVGGRVMSALGERQRRQAVAHGLVAPAAPDQDSAAESAADTTEDGTRGLGWAMLLEAIIPGGDSDSDDGGSGHGDYDSDWDAD